MNFVIAMEAEVGQKLVTSANAGAPDVARAIESVEVDEHEGLVGFELEGGGAATYPIDSQIEVLP